LNSGPVIRLGPRLLSVQGIEAVHSIYTSPTKWLKPPSQKPLSIHRHGALSSLTSLNDVKCRNILAPSLDAKSIASQQYVILNCADTALTVTEIACEGEKGKADVLQIARTYAFDVICTFPELEGG